MIWPPLLLGLSWGRRKRRFRLWLPLFLVWLPFVLFALVMAPLVVLASALLWPLGWGRTVLLAGPLLFGVFCSLRGLEINVEGPSGEFSLSFR